MASTSTYKVLLEDLAEKVVNGDILPSVTGTTTTLTLANSYGAGPIPNQAYPRGSVILITAGGGAGTTAFLDQYTASTGVFTVFGTITTGATDAIIVPFSVGLKHGDTLKDAVNKALTSRLCRWQKVPLTFVPGGDMLGVTVGDHWTPDDGTASYVEASFPEVVGRVLNYAYTAVDEVYSNIIPVRANEVWEFETAIRTTSDGSVRIYVRDNTNATEIPLTFNAGTGSTTSGAFVTQRGQFTIPATCEHIRFVFEIDGSNPISGQMAPIIAYPKDARTFPLQQRVIDIENRVGNFFNVRNGGGDTGPEERRYSEPITLGGRTVSFSTVGDHTNATFNFAPGTTYYDELVYGQSLSAMTDTTTFPREDVLRWSRYELLKFLYDKDESWKLKVYEAKKSADTFDRRSLYEPTRVGVV